jgi:diguanylate cyclase (GGDEF)-like protein
VQAIPGENGEQGPERPSDDAFVDALGPVVYSLSSATGLAPRDVARMLREALPGAIADLADANRRLREIARQDEALAGAAIAELRATAEVLLAAAPKAPGAGLAEEAARLHRLAGDLETAPRSPLDEHAVRRPVARDGERARVLVVDDDDDAREAVCQTLRDDYELMTASDGEAALEIVRARHPDAVLMDLFMPRMDGLQALERMRTDPVTRDIPVIFVSARGDDAVKARTFALGAVDYLQKPFSERELAARLARTLRLSRSQTALRELAQTDPLTGLPNLRAFRARLEEEVKRARRYATPLTCVMTDMDHLKPVNDELGHAAGDRAIAAVAAVIRAELRETDFAARYGGDEFVILLPHTDSDEGQVLAQRICDRLKENALDLSGRRIRTGASFGIASITEGEGDVAGDTLVRAADAALYRAKRAGRGRVAVAPLSAASDPREHT